MPGNVRLPSFTLHNQSGETISTQALHGRAVAVTFIDTACKDSCPIIAGVMGRAVSLLTPAERRHISALAISVDPSTDNPRSVGRFLRERGALGKLDFLLGSSQELQAAWRAFSILSAQESGDAAIHSAPVRIYDRQGRWVSTLHAGVDLTATNLVHDLRQAFQA